MWLTGTTSPNHEPIGGISLWGGERSMWAVGDAGFDRYRVVVENGTKLAVFGNCYASEAELTKGLAYVRSREWRNLTRWPGSYWVIADDGIQTVVLTDVSGSRPVYFSTTASGVTWATEAKPLGALDGGSLDYAAIAARAVCPTVTELVGTTSTFEGSIVCQAGTISSSVGVMHPFIAMRWPTRTVSMKSLWRFCVA